MAAEAPHLRVLWTLLEAENTKETCEEARTRMVRYLCLPDTVDPRGPKGE